MKGAWKHLLIPFLLVMIVVTGPSSAHAQQSVIIHRQTCNMNAFGITANIITCVRAIVKPVSDQIIRRVTGSIGRLIQAASILTIIFLGFRMVLGATRSVKHEMKTVLKVLFVMVVATNADDWIEWKDLLTDASLRLSDRIAGSNIYEEFDRIVLRVMGIDPAHGPTASFFIGIGVVLAGLFWTGIGAFITLLILGMLMVIIFTVFQIAWLFATSALALGILMGVGPIFLPMMLWEQTQRMFKKWFSHVMVYSIQPVMAVAALFIFVQAMDGLSLAMDDLYDTVRRLHMGQGVTDAERSKSTITLLEFPEEDIDPEHPEYKKYLEQKRLETGDPNWTPPSSDVVNYMPDAVPYSFAYNAGAWVVNKGVKLIGETWGKFEVPYLAFTEDMFTAFVSSMLGIYIMMWCMISFLKEVPQMTARIIDKASATPLSGLPGAGAIQNAESGIMSAFSNNSAMKKY